MPSKTFEENVEFEKKIQAELDYIYKNIFGDCIISRLGTSKYDLIITDNMTNKQYTIQEKIIRNSYSRLSVEIIQDIVTGNLGWIYKCQSDFLHWVMCDNQSPHKIYRVKLADFRSWYFQNCWRYSPDTFRLETDGWGKTLHQLIPINDIPELETIKLT